MLVLIVTFAAFVAGAGIITAMNTAPKGARREKCRSLDISPDDLHFASPRDFFLLEFALHCGDIAGLAFFQPSLGNPFIFT